MSNSSLATYTKISPNKTSPRNHSIDTLTIHCMAGNLTVEKCGDLFYSKLRRASSNYGIGSDGRIALYVEEKDRSWCSSNRANDMRAITIEVANDGGADTGWHVSSDAMNSLIELVVDICKRNGKKKLLWLGNKADTLAYSTKADEMVMTAHRWFANKACPGDYLYNNFGYIASKVNARIGEACAPENSGTPEKTFTPYTVIITASVLHVRSGAGTLNAVTGIVKSGEVYTIVDESGGWGKLKSGAGWICLKYTKRRS